ncbi:MAG: DUF4097 family beta strand repeat-containing protein [Oscillospiraceae bacterium]
MIKRMFAIFVPTCIVSFILFGATVMLFGKTSDSQATTESYIDYDSLEESFDNIQIDCSGAEIKIEKSADNTTKVVKEEGTTEFTVYVKNNTLFVESEWKFFGWNSNLGIKENISNIFKNPVMGISNLGGGKLTVYVPERMYNTLLVSLNAGTLKVSGIAADKNEINVNAGTFDYRALNTEAEFLGVTINAGNAEISGLNPREYRLDESAGDLCIRNLTGFGSVDISAGKTDLIYDSFNGDIQIGVSAGTLNMYVPDNTSAEINVDKSAGSVTVRADGEKHNLSDGATVTIGGGRYKINADISAGSINIENTDRAPKQKTAVETTCVTTGTQAAEITEVVVYGFDDALENAGNEIGDALENAGNKIDQALENAGNALDHAFSAIG